MSVEIRRADEGCAALFDCIAPEVFDRPVNPSLLADYLKEPGHILFLAVSEGQVVGQCAGVVHRHPDKPADLYIDEVGVAPAFRRRGVARRLMEAILALGSALGCEEAWVLTEAANGPARALYASLKAAGEPAILHIRRL